MGCRKAKALAKEGGAQEDNPIKTGHDIVVKENASVWVRRREP